MKTKNLFNKFFGKKIMTDKTVNYTDEMVHAMVADYSDKPTTDTVDRLATEFNKSTRSIVAKLVREGVYVAQPRLTKAGTPVIRKADLVASIQDRMGIELNTLEKASKADLINLLNALPEDTSKD